MRKYLWCLAVIASIPIAACSGGDSEMLRKLEFEYSGIEKVVVKAALFDVIIEGGIGGAAIGTIETGDEHVLQHRKTGSALEIWYERPFLKPLSSRTHSLRLRVPISADVKVENTSGDAVVKSIEARNLRVKTTSGDIRIQDIVSDIDLATTSGKIEAKESKADLRASSTSGKQYYNSIIGNIDANSGSGDIGIVSQEGSLKLRTTSGSIEGKAIAVSGNSSFSTTSGKIAINPENTLEDFTFDLNASSGRLAVGSQTAKGRLISGRGPIRIVGTSTSGSQSYGSEGR
jgi:hypothetical protein